MSAQHAPHDDAAAPAPADPYGIVPDSFTDDWGADSIPEALAKAEAAPSTTDPRAQQRCPDCLAARLTPLTEEYSSGEWACTECHARPAAVLPSQIEAERNAEHFPKHDGDPGSARCRNCLSTALYPFPESAPADDRWGCLDCGAGFDDALPSRRAQQRGEITRAEKRAVGEAFSGAVEWSGVRKPEVEPVGETEQVGFEEVRDD
jgi:ribosomal protein L37AE/L43A